ncbi:MAG: 2-C-methyl-D-erythritol 2,4-cyclodiphosphate synthase [Candidatus Hydrogenedens sp.]|nr:2-C-methyl-D-erythritol 2,4-cyclodiphosphate synthase [Candidatus Hydrogenedens sp.]
MYRIGQGYDLHRLEEGRELILAGVSIPFDKGLMGHSDADVLCHAVTDALLGALARGDIGSHFPDNDPAYKGADSVDLLQRIVRVVTGAGYKVENLDCTVVAERPKLRDYIDRMRQNLAEVLGVPTSHVSVKAKTNEGVGPEGRGEAISAQVVVLLSETPV